MSTAYSEYARVWQQVKHWPAECRQDLAEELGRSLVAEQLVSSGPWDETKNARRCELIDKDIQGAISREERRELDCLTQQMRAHRRSVAPIPIEGAIRLHQQLLDKKRQQEARGGAN